MNQFLFFHLFLIATISATAFAKPELRSAKALKTELKDGSFSAQLIEGYHFNEKAPNGIQVQDKFLKPTTLLPRTMKVDNLTGESVNGTAHVYVCDDKVTFCDMHSIPLSKSVKVQKTESKASKGKIDSHGFIVNDFEGALKKAQKENKLLMVDFGARWCPACIRLETEIFDDKNFKQKTKSFVKAKVDVDVFANEVLEDKYNIKGVPTLIFMSKEGSEIARFYDYQPMGFINDVLAEVAKRPIPIEELEKLEQIEKTDEIKLSLAKRYFFSDQNAKAVALMEPMNPKPKEFWFAKVGDAEAQAKKDPSLKKQYVNTLKAAITAEPESTRSIVWRMSLANELEDKEEAKSVAKASDELTTKLLANDEALKTAAETDIVGEYTGLEGFYVAMMNAEAAEAAQYQPKKAWEKVIAQGEKYKIDAKKPGASIRLLSAMTRAEQYEKALKLADDMLKLKPQDGDLQRRKMRVLIELKKYNEAIQIGEIALKNSYGVNEYFVVEPLAKAYINANQKEKAKKLINTYLSRNEINFSDLSAIKGKLEKLNQEI